MKRLLSAIAIAATAAFGGQAFAGNSAPPPGFAVSLGEASPTMLAFYECKPGPDTRSGATWKEVTTLMLTNTLWRQWAQVGIFDGNENLLAVTTTELSEFDLDELNICATLTAVGINPPPAGLITVLFTDAPFSGTVIGWPGQWIPGVPGSGVGPAVGAYCWVKNVLGRFSQRIADPFAGRVTGIGKTACRATPATWPDGTSTGADMVAVGLGILASQNPPLVLPILIEGTDDDGTDGTP